MIGIEKLMKGIPVPTNEIHPKLQLYLQISPGLDLQYRCLPRVGGYYDQDYEDIFWFNIIEHRIKEILARKEKEQEAKLKHNRGK